MIMVRHQAIGMDYHAESFSHLFDGFQVSSSVPFIAIDLLAFIASCRDVVDGVGRLDSDRAGHRRIISDEL